MVRDEKRKRATVDKLAKSQVILPFIVSNDLVLSAVRLRILGFRLKYSASTATMSSSDVLLSWQAMTSRIFTHTKRKNLRSEVCQHSIQYMLVLLFTAERHQHESS